MDHDGEWPRCGNRTIGRSALGAKVGRVSKMAGCWISCTAGMLVALNINWACVLKRQTYAPNGRRPRPSLLDRGLFLLRGCACCRASSDRRVDVVASEPSRPHTRGPLHELWNIVPKEYYGGPELGQCNLILGVSGVYFHGCPSRPVDDVNTS